MWAGESSCRFSRCCLQFLMGVPGLCSDSEVQRTLESSIVFLQTITIERRELLHQFVLLVFFVCMFVSAYSHFAYNSFLSYFLPVSSSTTGSQSLIYVQAFVHSPTSPSLRPSSETLLRIRLSPSCSQGTEQVFKGHVCSCSLLLCQMSKWPTHSWTVKSCSAVGGTSAIQKALADR